jgi:hypothetical protein
MHHHSLLLLYFCDLKEVLLVVILNLQWERGGGQRTGQDRKVESNR